MSDYASSARGTVAQSLVRTSSAVYTRSARGTTVAHLGPLARLYGPSARGTVQVTLAVDTNKVFVHYNGVWARGKVHLLDGGVWVTSP